MNLTEILNTIRSNASTEYQNSIPEATRNNISAVGAALLDNDAWANEFLSAIVNKIALTVVEAKRFKNPLAVLKKGSKPTADIVEDIYVNFAKASTYDETGADLLSRTLPDVKAVYMQMNRQDKYAVTVGPEQLAKAFRSYGDLENFINHIISSLYNGDEMDEFTLFKKSLSDAITKNMMKTVEVSDPCTSATNATEFVKTVKTLSSLMTFPSDQYNGYLTAQSTDTKPIKTLTRTEEQYIIIDTATNVAIDVDVLANAFNMNKQEFLARRIVIDAFPDEKIRAMIIDESFCKFYDDLYKITSFNNPEGLYTNYYLHHWQTIATTPLVNAIALTVADSGA